MDSNLCKHKLKSCRQCVVVTDAAKRMSETANIYILCNPWGVLVHTCMAFRLDDGSSDGTLYPDRSIALRYQLRPCCVLYFRNCMGGTNPTDCQIFLNVQRLAFESDRIAWIDPESPDIIISTRSAEIMKGVRRV